MDDELRHYMEKNEEILWSYHKVKDLKKNFLSIVYILIIIIIGFSIAAIIINLTFSDLLLMMITMVPIITFIIIVISGYRNYRKINSFYNLNEEQIRSYHNFYILTNKRWIQKQLFIQTTKYAMQLPKDLIKVENDLISINSKDIKIWVFYSDISLYVDIDEYHANKFTRIEAFNRHLSKYTTSLVNVLNSFPQYQKKEWSYGKIMFYTKELEEK